MFSTFSALIDIDPTLYNTFTNTIVISYGLIVPFTKVKWVIDNPNIGLKMKPQVDVDVNGEIIWKLQGICDATWGSCKDDGRSVTGYILYFMNVPISFKSKQQPLVTLSSCEAEYVGISELAKEIMFAKQLLEDFNIKVELPIRIYVDNQGAIQMVRNNKSGAGTKHVNCRFHFVRELRNDNILELIYVKSEDNEADMMCKNPTEAVFNKHTPKLVEEVPDMHRIKN